MPRTKKELEEAALEFVEDTKDSAFIQGSAEVEVEVVLPDPEPDREPEHVSVTSGQAGSFRFVNGKRVRG